MNTRFKVVASYNILQYLCDFIHVLILVTVSKCRKSPKLTNIVIYAEDRLAGDPSTAGSDYHVTTRIVVPHHIRFPHGLHMSST
jgi:hypothetical protein